MPEGVPLEAKEFSRISAFRIATSPETYIVHFLKMVHKSPPISEKKYPA